MANGSDFDVVSLKRDESRSTKSGLWDKVFAVDEKITGGFARSVFCLFCCVLKGTESLLANCALAGGILESLACKLLFSIAVEAV